MSGQSVKQPTVLFVFGSTPHAGHLERAQIVHQSGDFDVHYAYWHRSNSEISIPLGELLPQARLIPIRLPDPRGSRLRRVLLTLWFCLKLRRVVRELNPSVIYAININIAGAVKLSQLGRRRVPQVYELQDQFGVTLSKLYRWLYRWSVSDVRYTILHTEANQPYLLDNGLDDCSQPQTLIPPVPLNWQELARPTANQELTIGYFGILRGEIVLKTLAEAVIELVQEGHKLRLLFAGTGPDMDVVARLAAKHNFIDNHGRYEYFSEYPNLFSRADLIYAVYPTEHTHNKFAVARRFAEATTTGKPVVVQRDTHMADLIARHGGGWTVDGNNRQSVVEILRPLCLNRDRLAGVKADDQLAKLMRLDTYRQPLLNALKTALQPLETQPLNNL